MHRYLVFVWDTYYPSGGWEDFLAGHESLERALSVARDDSHENRQVVDTQTDLVVYFGRIAEHYSIGTILEGEGYWSSEFDSDRNALKEYYTNKVRADLLREQAEERFSTSEEDWAASVNWLGVPQL